MKSNPSDSELMPPPATPITTPSTPTTTPVSTPIEDKENSLTTPSPMKGSKSMVADPSKLQRTSGRYTCLIRQGIVYLNRNGNFCEGT